MRACVCESVPRRGGRRLPPPLAERHLALGWYCMYLPAEAGLCSLPSCVVLVVSEVGLLHFGAGDRLREPAPCTRSWALRISRRSIAPSLQSHQQQTNGFLYKATGTMGIEAGPCASGPGPGAGSGEEAWRAGSGKTAAPAARHECSHAAREREEEGYSEDANHASSRAGRRRWHDPAYSTGTLHPGSRVPLTRLVERWRC